MRKKIFLRLRDIFRCCFCDSFFSIGVVGFCGIIGFSSGMVRF